LTCERQNYFLLNLSKLSKIDGKTKFTLFLDTLFNYFCYSVVSKYIYIERH